MRPQYANLCYSGVHFDFFFSPKEAELHCKLGDYKKKNDRQSPLRSGEIAKKQKQKQNKTKE